MLADGKTPRYAREIAPEAGEVTIELQPLRAAPDDSRRVARGLVVDDRGAPVAGAVVSANSVKRENGSTTFGSIDGLDPYAVSDAGGRFRICHAEPIAAVGVAVRTPGFAPKIAVIETGDDVTRLALDVGATVVGSLTREGSGVPGTTVGLVQTTRHAGDFFGEMTIATNDAGQFTFNNVPRGHDYVVYAKMGTVPDDGATSVKRVRIEDPNVDIGILPVGVGHCMSGRITTTDGSTIPTGVRAMLSSELAWDSVMSTVEGGRFEFQGIPSGLYSLSIRVPGYRLSARNLSVRPSWPASLDGLIEDDITLIIELEPGQLDRPRGTPELWKREQQLREQPLRGVATGR